jgi:hypothetical protein
MKAPQLFVDTMGNKPKLTIVMADGQIKDIVQKACPNLKVEIINYDVDSDNDKEIRFDKQGKAYKVIEIK